VPDKTILIVHDDPEFVEPIRRTLAEIDPSFEVVNALSGPRAQAMIAQSLPAAMVVDAQLLGVDGFAFTRMIKTEPTTKDVPVIIVSLEANEASALKARQVGASALMSAAGQPTILVQKILALAGGVVAAPVATVPVAVGVPVIAPVPGSRVKPVGNAPDVSDQV